jgi:magnesium chelatase family protein
MAIILNTFSLEGIEGNRVTVEASLLDGPNVFTIIGLAEQSVKEAGERIEAALARYGFLLPEGKKVISLAPADIKKRGSHYDLSIAICLLAQCGMIKAKNPGKYIYIGELSLNGDLRPVKGVLPMVSEAKKQGFTDIIVPFENYHEAALLSGVNIYPFKSLASVISFLAGKTGSQDIEFPGELFSDEEFQTLDFEDVKGQDELIDAIVLGASGGHNILMIGEPGCGKSMIASRIPTILPSMSEEECLDVTKIYSIAGLLKKSGYLINKRPFRAPHHNASLNALIGGGQGATPGDVTLAHNGVLFLDEMTEFSRTTLEALRQPLENRYVTISRVNYSNTYPADFMLVAAMNPCPCGYHPGKRCRCSDYEIQKYRNKISGPILDRIDIQKNVRPVGYFDIKDSKGRSSKELKTIVERTRKIQQKRYKDIPGVSNNAGMTPALIGKYCVLDRESDDILREACERHAYSARAINKMLKVARTSADLDESENIRAKDILRVLSCRDLDSAEDLYVV